LRVYLQAPRVESKSLDRVATALKLYAPPEVEVVDSYSEAELVILHVIGRKEQMETGAASLMFAGKNYAVIQYCVRSTQKPNTADWVDFWKHAKLVWSYYDLKEMCREDGSKFNMNFYHAPLAASSVVFEDRLNLNGNRPYLAMTHGQSWLTEGVREVVWASRRVGKPVFHLGQSFHRGHGIHSAHNITDVALADKYASCDYVCPLRRVEGFELPAVEGLLCGTRPVLFDAPHYKQWYGDLAEYIPEVPRPGVVEALVELFKKERRLVTSRERAYVAEFFNWPRIATQFWERVLN